MFAKLRTSLGLSVMVVLFGSIAAGSTPKVVDLKDAAGRTLGKATLTSLARGVQMKIEVQKLTPGPHAIHIHEKGACVGPKFDSAGGHFAPNSKVHGFDSADGHHAGDLPNLVVLKDGTASAEFINTAVTLGEGSNSLLRDGGTSIVIHENADDHKSQPAGNAGARIVCGVISK